MSMEVKVVSKRYNPLVGRTEVDFEVHSDETPRRFDVRKELASMLDVELDRVYVVRMLTKTGLRLTVGRAHVYDSAERAAFIEPEHIKKRNSPEAEGGGG